MRDVYSDNYAPTTTATNPSAERCVRRSALDMKVVEAPLFYSSYFFMLLVGVLVTLSGVNIVQLNIHIEVCTFEFVNLFKIQV